MGADDRRHGKNGAIMMDPTGASTTPVALVSMNKWDLDLSTDKVKVTCFGDPNQIYRQGLPDIKGSWGGEWDSSANGQIIFTALFSDVAPYLKLVPDSVLDADEFFAGKALIDGKISVDVNGDVKTSGAFVAAGPWVLPVAA